MRVNRDKRLLQEAEMTEDFLNKLAGYRDGYYRRKRELGAINQFIEKMDNEKRKPITMTIGIHQDEEIKIDRQRMEVLAKQIEKEIVEVESKIHQLSTEFAKSTNNADEKEI